MTENSYACTGPGWMDGLSQKRTRAYRVDGLVKNIMILGIRTFWMTPYKIVIFLLDGMLNNSSR